MYQNIWNDSYFSYISIHVISTIGYITNLQWPALQTVMPELASIFSGSFSTAHVVYSTVSIISTFTVFFNGNKEKSYLRLSLKSFQWLFSTFIFKKNMENIPFLFAPRFNELLQSGEVELSGAPKYTFLIENDFKHVIKQYRRLH